MVLFQNKTWIMKESLTSKTDQNGVFVTQCSKPEVSFLPSPPRRKTMGCVQCKDKEATKLTDERENSITQHSGYRYGSDPTPQHYPSFGVTAIPNYNNFHTPVSQGVTVFGGVNSSSNTGTLRSRGGTGKILSPYCCSYKEIHTWPSVSADLISIQHYLFL